LPAQLGGQAGHFFFEGLAIVLDRGCADVPARGKDVAVMADLVQVSIGMKSVPFMGIEKCTTHNQNETS
jgi:hypothetical protein